MNNVKNRLTVFLDIAIDNIERGRIVLELYSDLLPKTTSNFYHLCVGDKGIGRDTNKPLRYEGCVFHQVVKGVMVQGGDFSHACGVGGESIFGGKFEDEGFPKRHYRAGMVSMANSGPNSNGSQFFLTFARTPSFDSKHVAFGHIKSGLDVLQEIEAVPTDRNDKPMGEVRIIRCGDYSQFLEIQKSVLQSEEDKNNSKIAQKRLETRQIVQNSLSFEDSDDCDEEKPRTAKEKRFLELQKLFKESKNDTKREVRRELRRIGTKKVEKAKGVKGVWRKRAMTAEDAGRLYAKKEKKEEDRTFGAYLRQIERLEKSDGDGDDSLVDANRVEMYQKVKDRPEKVAQLANEISSAQTNRRKFSRRRRFNEEKDVSFINRRNEAFNDKVARAFDKYTFEIKSNFERGTAL